MFDRRNTGDGDLPAFWSFEDDGRRVAGTYVQATEIPTENGLKAALVLEVNGEPRTVPCWHDSLHYRIADELARRKPNSFEEGERIEITQGDRRPSKNAGRTVIPYVVRFPDAPRRSEADIFGPPSSEGITRPNEEGGDERDDIPF